LLSLPSTPNSGCVVSIMSSMVKCLKWDPIHENTIIVEKREALMPRTWKYNSQSTELLLMYWLTKFFYNYTFQYFWMTYIMTKCLSFTKIIIIRDSCAALLPWNQLCIEFTLTTAELLLLKRKAFYIWEFFEQIFLNYY
jgi:hypothetical protein